MKTHNHNGVIIQEGDDILVHKLPPYKLADIPAPVIRWLTKCYYNHVATVGVYLGELYIIEAIGNGFVPSMTLKKYLKTVGKQREIRIIRPVEAISVELLNIRLSRIVNKKYDFKSLLWYQLRFQLSKSKEWKGKKGTAAENQIYCSEAIALKYPEIFDSPWLTTPADIHFSQKFNTIYESNYQKRIIFES